MENALEEARVRRTNTDAHKQECDVRVKQHQVRHDQMAKDVNDRKRVAHENMMTMKRNEDELDTLQRRVDSHQAEVEKAIKTVLVDLKCIFLIL
jgi:hypothetical protein